MRQRTKKLTDPIPMSRLAPEPRGAVGYGFAQRLAGMFKLSELCVLSETGQNAHSSIGDDKFKRIAAHGVGGKSGVDPTAVGIDVVLQFSQCAKKFFNKSSRHIVRCCGIFSVFGPLLPERLIAGLRIVTKQWENARDVVDPVAGDRAFIERAIYHSDETRVERDSAISVWQEAAGHGQLDQRTNSSRFSDADTSCLRKSAGDGLPEQIVSILKAALNFACRLHAVLANPYCSVLQHNPITAPRPSFATPEAPSTGYRIG
jgi:hypothetical protein